MQRFNIVIEHTVLSDTGRLEIVFLFALKSRSNRGGAKRRSKAAGITAKIDCSKRRVKSKLERQPDTAGPNTLSRQVDVIVEVLEARPNAPQASS